MMTKYNEWKREAVARTFFDAARVLSVCAISFDQIGWQICDNNHILNARFVRILFILVPYLCSSSSSSHSSSFFLLCLAFFTNYSFVLLLLVAKSSMKNSRSLCLFSCTTAQCTSSVYLCTYVLQLSSSPALKLHYGNYRANLMTFVVAIAATATATATVCAQHYNSLSVHVFLLFNSQFFKFESTHISLESRKTMHTWIIYYTIIYNIHIMWLGVNYFVPIFF